jgi:hypothetical protein
MRRAILRVLSSFRSSRAEQQLAREIRSHRQLLEDQYTVMMRPHVVYEGGWLFRAIA